MEHPLQGDASKLAAGEQINFNNLSRSDKYWAVTLDGKVTKTMYKDNLFIPSKALAVAIAEEWESQHENIDLKSLHIVSTVPVIKNIEQLSSQMCQGCSRY
jgi:chaperone required for assembly of F1-ATPase